MLSKTDNTSRVLVIGAYGLLGSLLSDWLTKSGHSVFRQGRNSDAEQPADPSDATTLAGLIDHCCPDVIINLVAETNVDLCEEDPQRAFLANVRIVESVSEAIIGSRLHTAPHLVHISTDQVYDGIGPHSELDTRPCNVYALSKYAGELAAERVKATVLRTNFAGRSRCAGRTSLSDWIVTSLQAGKHITVFDDVLFSALSISTLCSFIENTMCHKIPGIFNVGTRDGISKAQFAVRLAKCLQLDNSLMTVGTSSDVTLRARRPKDMRLDTARFEKTFGLSMPSMDEEILVIAEGYHHD